MKTFSDVGNNITVCPSAEAAPITPSQICYIAKDGEHGARDMATDRGREITEKHYAPWVLARQEQLEADVMRTWGKDKLVLASAKRTPEVHEKMEAVN